jgi:electron transfer flavoprotein beta subunit
VKILATIKRVADPDMKIKISADGSSIDTSNAEYTYNQMDEYGVEEALRLKEKHDAEVVVVSVGPADAVKEIRTAGLAVGADRGILVETDADLDSDGVARLLAEVVRREEPDMILMGKLSLDTDRNQTGQLLATYLDYPQATFAYNVEIADGWATVGREIDGGTNTKRVRLPAIITAIERLNEPRYASLPGIMKAKRKTIDTLTPEELGVDIAPKVKAVRYELPPERAAGEIVEDVDALINKLKNEAKVI